MAVKMEKAAAKIQVMLGNGCKRYAYKGMVYEAGIKYDVSADKQKDLFGRTDDNGVRYFYDAAVVEASVKKAIQRKRRNAIPMEVSPAQFANIMTEIANDQEEESVQVRDTGETDTAGDADAVEV